MSFRDNLDQLSAADRWYYNAILTNPNSGDVAPVAARYTEQRTVPLIGNCEEYYMALARLSVQGTTGNFPILQPVLQALTPSSSDPFVNTDYWVGVRTTVWSALSPDSGSLTLTSSTNSFCVQSGTSPVPVGFPNSVYTVTVAATTYTYAALAAAIQTQMLTFPDLTGSTCTYNATTRLFTITAKGFTSPSQYMFLTTTSADPGSIQPSTGLLPLLGFSQTSYRGVLGQNTLTVTSAYEVPATPPSTNGDGALRVIGYQNMSTAPIVLPSSNPSAPRGDADSSFYSVYCLQDLMDGLNTAVRYALSTSGGPITYTQSGFSWQPSSTAQLVSDGVSGVPLLKCTADAGNKLVVQAAALIDSTTVLPNPFIGPAKSSVTGVPAGYYFTCQLFFSDKLLELLPMPVVPPYSVYGPNVSGTIGAGTYSVAASTPSYQWAPTSTPLLTNSTTVSSALAPTAGDYTFGQFLPWNSYTLLSGRGFYALALYPHRASTSTDDFVLATAYDPAATSPAFSGIQTLLTGRAVTWLTWAQEYSTQSGWSVYTGLAITSNTIPAYEEAYGTNILYDENSVASAAAGTSNVIFDIDLTQDELHQIQSGISFVPSAFRYAKLKGGQLNTIDLRLWLRKRNGQFVPWTMDAGGTINIKLMFTKVPY